MRRGWGRRPRPLPLDNPRARADVFHVRRTGRAVGTLNEARAEPHAVQSRSTTGASHSFPGAVHDADLFPHLGWRRWRAGAHAPCSCLGNDALPDHGRRGPWAWPRPFDCLDVSLAENEGTSFRPANLFSHEAWQARLSLHDLFTFTDCYLGCAAAGQRHGHRGWAVSPPFFPTLVDDFVLSRRRWPSPFFTALVDDLVLSRRGRPSPFLTTFALVHYVLFTGRGRASPRRRAPPWWLIVFIVDIPLFIAAVCFRHCGRLGSTGPPV